MRKRSKRFASGGPSAGSSPKLGSSSTKSGNLSGPQETPSPSLSVRAVKCSCRQIWCPTCSLRGDMSIACLPDRLGSWDYRCVREVIFTIDPKMFDFDGESAFNYVKEKKLVRQVLHNLVRTRGIVILDWVKILEWHRHGFPHWHVLILTDKAGKAGMIHGDKLRPYWGIGGVTETYIRSELHWKRKFGYYAKKGYFQKSKAHQSILPDWARRLRRAPSRVTSKRKRRNLAKNPFDEKTEPKKWLRYETWRQIELRKVRYKTGACHAGDDQWDDLFFIKEKLKPGAEYSDSLRQLEIKTRQDGLGIWFEKQSDPLTRERTAGEKIDLCGETVELFIGPSWSISLGKIGLPYREILGFNGQYIDGLGYRLDLPRPIIDYLFRSYDYSEKIRSVLCNGEN